MLSEAPDEDVLKFARSLVHPEKSIRDKTLKTLQNYLSNETYFDDLSMLKLWKALYYCMWLADKAPIQEELADNLSKLLFIFHLESYQFLFLQMFYRIILYEWSSLDQYRINKMYLLIRKNFYYSLKFIFDKKKNENIIKFVTLLYDEVLIKVPNGIRFHLVDIFYEELYRVTNGEISTQTFLLMIQPFLNIFINTNKISTSILAMNNIFMDRIKKGIFEEFLLNYCKEQYFHENNDDDDDNEKKGFKKVQTEVIQKKIFDLAALEEISTNNRKRLYEIHRLFAQVTGKDFITDDIFIDDDEEEEEEKKKKEGEGNNKKKSIKKKQSSIKAVESSDTIKKHETRTLMKRNFEDEHLKDSLDHKKKQKKEEINTSSILKNSTLKKDTTMKETAAVNAENETQQSEFIKSKRFNGAKHGYAFRTGLQGLGYYKDTPPIVSKRSVSFNKKQLINKTSSRRRQQR